MKICRHCGCQTYEALKYRHWKPVGGSSLLIEEFYEDLPSWIVEGRDYPIGKSFSVCPCPCHYLGALGEKDYRHAVEEILGYKQEGEDGEKEHP